MSFYNRPLRPTRAFQNASEQYKITDIVKMKSIYSHTNAYLYITQDGSLFKSANLKKINDYAIIDLFSTNSNYFDLNDFINYKLARKIYTAYIIITSSIIDLKYEVKYLASKTTPTLSSVIIEIDIDEIEQISFADTDINILQGIK